MFAPASSGHPFDVLVVADEDLWQRRAGRALADVLATRMPGLPQPEPSFRVMHASPAHFDATLKRVRNIVVADVRSGCTQAALSTAGNVNASPQSILLIEAPDETSFWQCVQDNRQQIVDYFVRAEMDRQVQALERDLVRQLEASLYTLRLPGGAAAARDDGAGADGSPVLA